MCSNSVYIYGDCGWCYWIFHFDWSFHFRCNGRGENEGPPTFTGVYGESAESSAAPSFFVAEKIEGMLVNTVVLLCGEKTWDFLAGNVYGGCGEFPAV